MPDKWSKRKIFRTVWFSLVTVFTLWNWNTFQSHNLPQYTFSNSADINVKETNDKITFESINSEHQLEVIFFQGGLTDPKAYGPLCKNLAEKGFTSHLIKMDWRLPVLDYEKVPNLFDLEQGQYVIGGHSQGAKMAAQLVAENPESFKGLFLMGTSHPRDIDLSPLDIPCIKLYAEYDGLASVEEVMANEGKLPMHTEFIMIKGGNHSQFGYLGQLLMDNTAEISLEKQQNQTLMHLLIFIEEIAGTPGN